MPFLNRDYVEIQKTILELPKVAILITSFFATAAALILREGPSGNGLTAMLGVIFSLSPDTVDALSSYVIFCGKVVYVVGLTLTVSFMYKCYHFMALVGKNVTTEVKVDSVTAESDGVDLEDTRLDKVVETEVRRQLKELIDDKYPPVKRAMNVAVVSWATILAVFVFML